MKTYRRTLLALALSTASCSGKEDVPRKPNLEKPAAPDDADVVDSCTADDLPSGSSCEAPAVYVSVQDENGFPLAADSVAFIAPGCDEPVPCRPRDNLDPLAPANQFVCRVPKEAIAEPPSRFGPHTLPLVIGRGDEEYQLDEAPLRYDELPNPTCVWIALPRLPVAPCIDLNASAIEGTIVGAAEGATLRVLLSEPYTFDGDSIWSPGRNVECEVHGANYRCPSLGFDYTRQHFLTVVEGDKVLLQHVVRITIDACDVVTSRYDPDRATCDIGVWFGIDGRGVASDELEVTVGPGRNLPAATCTRLASDALIYRCTTGAADASNPRLVEITNRDGTTVSAITSSSSGCGVRGGLWPRGSIGRTPPPESPAILLSLEQLRELGLQ